MDSSLLKKIWFIETVPKDETETTCVRGGGLCIDPSGLILTVAHIVSLRGFKRDQIEIQARAYEDKDLFERVITVIDVSHQHDLALIKASKSKDEVFDYLPIGESVQVEIEEKVFAYVHQSGWPFSLLSGTTCYPLPNNVTLPDVSDKTTMESSGYLKKNPTHDIYQSYRTVSSVATESDNEFYDLHPNLPFVQVSGFGVVAGASGCPLFKWGSGEFIGLFAIQKLAYHFAIPVNFLKKYVDYVLEGKGLGS